MTFHRLSALALAGLALAAPTTAQASRASVATARALRVAAATFGAPCGGTPVELTWGDPHRWVGDGGHGGWAAWTGADGRPQGEGSTSLRTHCRVRVDAALALEWRRHGWREWALYCTVIVHEVGHLTGHEHSENPYDVMAATMSVSAPQCWRAALRYGYAD